MRRGRVWEESPVLRARSDQWQAYRWENGIHIFAHDRYEFIQATVARCVFWILKPSQIEIYWLSIQLLVGAKPATGQQKKTIPSTESFERSTTTTRYGRARSRSLDSISSISNTSMDDSPPGKQRARAHNVVVNNVDDGDDDEVVIVASSSSGRANHKRTRSRSPQRFTIFRYFPFPFHLPFAAKINFENQKTKTVRIWSLIRLSFIVDLPF